MAERRSLVEGLARISHCAACFRGLAAAGSGCWPGRCEQRSMRTPRSLRAPPDRGGFRPSARTASAEGRMSR